MAPMMPPEDKPTLLDSPMVTWFLACTIIFSVICFSIETLPDISSDVQRFLTWSERIVIVIFTGEYLYRLAVARHRLRFVFSFYGMIDLLAILPFFLTLAVDLRSLRLLRFVRLLRLLKLARYNRAMHRFVMAVAMAREELAIFLSITLVLLYLAAFGIFQFEHAAQPDKFRSIFDAMWWAVATLTTVGYGDIYPITVGGRIFTFTILILGLGLVAVPTGIVASALSAVRRAANAETARDGASEAD